LRHVFCLFYLRNVNTNTNSSPPKNLKARINSIGKARENSIVEKDAKKIKKC